MAYRETFVVQITVEAMEEEDLEDGRASVQQLVDFLNSATPMIVEMKTTIPPVDMDELIEKMIKKEKDRKAYM